MELGELLSSNLETPTFYCSVHVSPWRVAAPWFDCSMLRVCPHHWCALDHVEKGSGGEFEYIFCLRNPAIETCRYESHDATEQAPVLGLYIM